MSLSRYVTIWFAIFSCMSICLSIYPVYLSVYLTIFLAIYLSFFLPSWASAEDVQLHWLLDLRHCVRFWEEVSIPNCLKVVAAWDWAGRPNDFFQRPIQCQSSEKCCGLSLHRTDYVFGTKSDISPECSIYISYSSKWSGETEPTSQPQESSPKNRSISGGGCIAFSYISFGGTPHDNPRGERVPNLRTQKPGAKGR